MEPFNPQIGALFQFIGEVKVQGHHDHSCHMTMESQRQDKMNFEVNGRNKDWNNFQLDSKKDKMFLPNERDQLNLQKMSTMSQHDSWSESEMDTLSISNLINNADRNDSLSNKVIKLDQTDVSDQRAVKFDSSSNNDREKNKTDETETFDKCSENKDARKNNMNETDPTEVSDNQSARQMDSSIEDIFNVSSEVEEEEEFHKLERTKRKNLEEACEISKRLCTSPEPQSEISFDKNLHIEKAVDKNTSSDNADETENVKSDQYLSNNQAYRLINDDKKLGHGCIEGQGHSASPLIVQARIVRCVDGLDLVKYQQAIEAQRKYFEERAKFVKIR